MCNGIDIKSMDAKEDQGWHPNAPVVMEHGNNRNRDIAIALNIQHNPYTYSHTALSAQE